MGIKLALVAMLGGAVMGFVPTAHAEDDPCVTCSGAGCTLTTAPCAVRRLELVRCDEICEVIESGGE